MTRWIIQELDLNRATQEAGFRQQWNSTQVRIIVLDGSVGWVQTVSKDDELFVAQLFVDIRFQRKGVGTEMMKRLISEAPALNLCCVHECSANQSGAATL